jgi:hypothetical protein
MTLFNLFAEPLVAMLLLGVAYAIMFGGFNSRFAKLFLKWALVIVAANILVRMFVPH